MMSGAIVIATGMGGITRIWTVQADWVVIPIVAAP